jgi:hypothetical protein
MNFVKTVLGLSLCAATAGATPATLTAGLFTFSDIQFGGFQGSLPTITADVSASAVSTDESGGISSITFTESGVPASNLGSEILFLFNVNYTGVDPNANYITTGYDYHISQSQNGTYSLFDCPDFSCSGGANGNNLNGTSGYLAGNSLNTSLNSFSIQGTAQFVNPDPSTGSGFYTIEFAAVDAPVSYSPEPSSIGLYTVSFGALLIGAFR